MPRILWVFATVGTVVSLGCTGEVLSPPATGPLGVSTPPPMEQLPPTQVSDTPLRRLSREEYNNTVRDLLGDTTAPANNFTPDQPAFIFDNNAALMHVLDAQMELYEQTADTLVTTALAEGSPVRSTLLTCDPASGIDCVKAIVSGFASRAWRRPAEADDVADLLALVAQATAQGDDAEVGIAWALKAVLLSPRFLFRVEAASPSGAHPIDAYELATRLSYFLWSSTPDDRLLAHAADGSLLDASTYSAEVTRMLDDPKASSFQTSFAAQWLSLNTLDSPTAVAPDSTMFPTFGLATRDAMKHETEALFDSVLRSGASALDLVDAPYTFVDKTLAQLYGLPGTFDDSWSRVDLAGTPRAGLLGHGSFLTVTSHESSTSPTRRGKFILSRILCTPPGDPPAGVPPLNQGTDPTAPIRVKLAAHAQPGTTCYGCHSIMDPIGFAPEHFGPIGEWRTEDEFNNPIDATGKLTDGAAFDGLTAFEQVLRSDPTSKAQLRRCFVRNFYSYALGREPTAADQQFIDWLALRYAQQGDALPALIGLIANTTSFRNRGESP